MTASASNSKTIYAPSGGGYGFTFSVSWSESSPSVATNKSRISASASLGSSDTSFANNYSQHLSVYWYDNNKYPNGVKLGGLDFTSCGMGYGTRTVTGSIDVEHKDDGTLSGYCVSFFSKNNGGSFTPPDSSIATSTQNLETIARASLPSVSPNPITLSQATNVLTVTTNRKSTSFTHDITCAIGSFTSTQTDVGESTTFDIPKTVISDFDANAKTLEGTISCVTKVVKTENGVTTTTTIGTKTVNFNAQIDEAQEHPNITSVTLTDTNPNSAAIEAQGSYIKYATNLSASIALGVTGSYTQLASAVVQCGAKQQTYALSGTSQTITFTYEKLDADALIITVYDKRGTTATRTETWTLIPYRDITVTGSVDRMSETGNTISFNLSGACFGGSFGNATNTVTVSYKYKLHNASTWTTGSQTFTFTPSGSGETTYSYSNSISGFDYDQQYDIMFTVTDMFTSATTRALVLTVGIPVYGNGEDFFAVYGKSYLHFDRDNPSKYWDLKDGLDAILEYHAQTNLMTIECETSTVGGITYTVNDDGTITANGTATEDSTLKVGVSKRLDTTKTWYFSGCPSGGSSSTYYCGWETAVVSPEFPPLVMAADTGNGSELIPIWGYPAYCPFYIVIKSGTTVSDITFKPMIRDIRIASDTFVPTYDTDGHELTTWQNSWNTNGQSYWQRIGNMVYMQVTMRDGTTTDGTVALTLPYEADATVITGMLSTSGVNGYARVSGTQLTVHSVSTNTNCMFQIAYKIK